MKHFQLLHHLHQLCIIICLLYDHLYLIFQGCVCNKIFSFPSKNGWICLEFLCLEFRSRGTALPIKTWTLHWAARGESKSVSGVCPTPSTKQIKKGVWRVLEISCVNMSTDPCICRAQRLLHNCTRSSFKRNLRWAFSHLRVFGGGGGAHGE